MGCYVQAQHPNPLHAYTIQGFAQGTSYSIKYYAESPIPKQSIDSMLTVIDNSMSIYKADSKITLFNDPNTNEIVMDQHMKIVIAESIKTYKQTKGYFDITIMPLVNLWGFGPKGFKNEPQEEQIKEALKVVGMKNIKVIGDRLIKKKKGVSIDVNGIAQGYTVDLLSAYFEAQQITNFIIEVGGEIRASGRKPQGDFIVEIQRPYQSPELSNYKVRLNNKAITTSGTYEKQVKVGNKIVSHHIDPKTGYPITNKTVSVTVIANSALEADALDNYLMFIDPQKVIQFIEKQKGMEVYVVYFENKMLKELQSSGFNNYIYN